MSKDDIKVYRTKSSRHYNYMSKECTGAIIQRLHYNYSNISQDRIRQIVENHAPCVIDMGDGTLWQIACVPNFLDPRSWAVQFDELKKVEV